MVAIEPGVDMLIDAGMEWVRAKSVDQSEFLIELWEFFLKPHGVTLNSPRDSSKRGSHISFGHPNAFQVDQALIEEMNVIPDFRQPDNIRFGITPLTTTFEELALAVLRMNAIFEEKLYLNYPAEATGVT